MGYDGLKVYTWYLGYTCYHCPLPTIVVSGISTSFCGRLELWRAAVDFLPYGQVQPSHWHDCQVILSMFMYVHVSIDRCSFLVRHFKSCLEPRVNVCVGTGRHFFRQRFHERPQYTCRPLYTYVDLITKPIFFLSLHHPPDGSILDV